MSEEKIYVGSAHVVQTQYGDITSLFLHADGLAKIADYATGNGGIVNLSVVEKKPESQKERNTHYVCIDTWKPKQSVNYEAPAGSEDEGGLPF